ncbi:transposase, partial [Oenococcus oeni]
VCVDNFPRYLQSVNQFIPKFVGNFDSFHFFKTFPQAKLSTNTRSFHNLTAYPQNPHKKQGYLLTSCGYVVN